MLVTKQLLYSIDFHSIEKQKWKSMGTRNG